MRTKLAAVVTVVAGLLAGALVTHPAQAAPAARAHSAAHAGRGQAGAGTDWTVMMYMSADNNLDRDELLQLSTATAAQFGANAKLVAFVDRAADAKVPYLNLGLFTDAKLIEVTPSKLVEVQDLDEVDMGKADTLSWFIREASKRYPARHYALHLLDHGGAWHGVDWDDSAPSEDGHTSHLSLQDVTTGLHDGLAASGIDKLDVLNMSACLMGAFEVASAVAPYADYLVASEEIAYGHMYDMGDIMTLLEKGGVSAEELSKAYVDSYHELAAQYGTDGVESYAALDLRQMPEFEKQMVGLEQALSENMDSTVLALADARANALTFGALDLPGVENDYPQVDIGDLLLHLASEEDPAPPDDVIRWATSVKAALARMVLLQHPGTSTASATGMSLWFPQSAKEGLADLDLYKSQAAAGAWTDVLEKYYKAVQRETAATPLEYAGPISVTPATGGVLVSAPVSRKVRSLLTEVGFQALTKLADGRRVMLLMQPGTTQSTSVGAGWDQKVFTVGDGTTTATVTSLVVPTIDGFDVQIPVRYTPPNGEPGEGVMYLSGESLDQLELQGVMVETPDAGFVAKTLEPGGKLVPEVVVYPAGSGAGSYAPAVSVALDAGSVRVGHSSLPAGQQLLLSLVMTDANDRSKFLSGTYTTP
jgi:hypothetical protein